MPVWCKPWALGSSKKTVRFTFPVFCLLFGALWARAEPVVFDSGEERVALLELFTSQGCSSCPSADRWLSQFTGNPSLWEKVVPVAWHVDYWDRLGWDDPFAHKSNTQRQYGYYRAGRVRSVYTPGFVLNGSEWTGLHRGEPLRIPAEKAPRLTASLDEGVLTAKVSADKTERLILHVALLGVGFSTEVKRGENRGRRLAEDFVVLGYRSEPSDDGDWEMPLDFTLKVTAPRYALALWVTESGSPEPLQAAGEWVQGDELTPPS